MRALGFTVKEIKKQDERRVKVTYTVLAGNKIEAHIAPILQHYSNSLRSYLLTDSILASSMLRLNSAKALV